MFYGVKYHLFHCAGGFPRGQELKRVPGLTPVSTWITFISTSQLKLLLRRGDELRGAVYHHYCVFTTQNTEDLKPDSDSTFSVQLLFSLNVGNPALGLQSDRSATASSF